jgi:hypothetical protein
MTPADDEQQQPQDEPPPLAPGERESAAPKMPVMPTRPVTQIPPERRGRGPFASTLSAIVAVVILCGGVLLCSFGNLMWPVIIAGAIFGLAALHYLIWGWWLSKAIHRQVEEEERSPKDNGF